MIVTLLPLLLLVSLLSFINAAHTTVTDQTKEVGGDPPSTRKLNRFLRKIHPSFVLCGGNSYCFKRTMDCVDEKCQCKDGLVFDEDRRHCNEIDECKLDNICTTDAFCVDHFATQHGYKCECYSGFESILEEPDSTKMVDGIETGFLKGVPITLRPVFCAWAGEKNIVIEAKMNLGEFTDASLAKAVAVDYFKFLLEASGVTLSLDKSSEETRTFYPSVIDNSVEVDGSILEITFHVILSSKVSNSVIIVEDDIDMSLELPNGNVIVFGQSVASEEGAAYIADKINDASEQVVEIQFYLSQILYFVVENGMTLLSAPSSSPSLLPSITSSLLPSNTPSSVPSFVPSNVPSLTPTESPIDLTESPTFLFFLTDTGELIEEDITRLYRTDDNDPYTLDECAQDCKAFPGCEQFSWASDEVANSNTKGICIGGTGATNLRSVTGFNTYSMNVVKPAGPSKFTLALEDKNIPSDSTRLFRDKIGYGNTLIECFELCNANENCKQFSWGSEKVATGSLRGVCIGGNGLSSAYSDLAGFLIYDMNP